MKILNWVLYLLPIGLCCLVAGQVGVLGTIVLAAMAKLIVLYFAVCILLCILYTVALRLVTGMGVIRILAAMRDPLLVAFVTRSSIAAIPLALDRMRTELGQPDEVASLVIPLSVVINRHAFILLFSMVAVFVAQLFQIHLSLFQQVLLMAAAVISGMAAVGAPSAIAPMVAYVLIPLGLPASIGVAIIVAMGPIIDPIATLTNLYGGCATTALVADTARRKECSAKDTPVKKISGLSTDHPVQKQIIGIAGGLGPFAHIDLERKLLLAAREITGANADQLFPEWIVSSVPQTPDRTRAIEGNGPDPTPWLVRSVKRLEGVRDAQRAGPSAAERILPLFPASRLMPSSMESDGKPPSKFSTWLTKLHCTFPVCIPGREWESWPRQGTLKRRLFHDKLKRHGHTPLSLFDVDNGEGLQRSYVMEAIYGPWQGDHFGCGGIKSCGPQRRHTLLLRKAADVLINRLHVDVIVAGCTEIPLALTNTEIRGIPLVDPVGVLACAAIRRAFGIVQKRRVSHRKEALVQ